VDGRAPVLWQTCGLRWSVPTTGSPLRLGRRHIARLRHGGASRRVASADPGRGMDGSGPGPSGHGLMGEGCGRVRPARGESPATGRGAATRPGANGSGATMGVGVGRWAEA
jgi:hypothetical protein